MITLDDLDVVASVTWRIATQTDIENVIAELRSGNVDVDNYTVTWDEVAAVLRMRELIVEDIAAYKKASYVAVRTPELNRMEMI